MCLFPLNRLVFYKDSVHVMFLGGERAGSGLQELETQVANCGTVSDSDNICTYTMNLHSVKEYSLIHQCFYHLQCESSNVNHLFSI